MQQFPIISGIQQVGIGVTQADEAWAWYRKYFGMNVPIFKDAAVAKLMTRYTSGIAQERYAILAMNMQGGGGFEIWQYTSKAAQAPLEKPKLGDLGIYAIKIRCKDAQATYAYFKGEGLKLRSTPISDPAGNIHFYVEDPYGNLFDIVEHHAWFTRNEQLTGGVLGCVIGVSDLNRSIRFYRDVLAYDTVQEFTEADYEDLTPLTPAPCPVKRALLTHEQERKGAFSPLLCKTTLELIERTDKKGIPIFRDRDWGDLGFIHLCFDINGMQALKARCAKFGHPFTVDSSDSFDMGKAAGHFAYCEDPDGTLIEFVETHKIPIFEKIGWYLNLQKRDPEKPLPRWLLHLLGLNKVKG